MKDIHALSFLFVRCEHAHGNQALIKEWTNRIVRSLGVSPEQLETINVAHEEALPTLTRIHEKYDGIILSGSTANVTDPIEGRPEWRAKYREWLSSIVLDSQIVPTLGICFSFQELIDITGGKVVREPIRTVGIEHIVLKSAGKKHALLSGLQEVGNDRYPVFASHGDAVAVSTSEWEVLAEDHNSRIQVAAHHTRPIYGVQFHPEVTKEITHKLIDTFLSKGEYPGGIEAYNTMKEQIERYGEVTNENSIRIMHNFREIVRATQ